MGSRKIADQIADIVKLIVEGKTLAEAAVACGVSPTQAAKWSRSGREGVYPYSKLHDATAPKPALHYTPEVGEVIKSMYRKGCTAPVIAHALGVKTQDIYRWSSAYDLRRASQACDPGGVPSLGEEALFAVEIKDA